MRNYLFNLIDTSYPLNEAREVIFSLIYEKIKFLNRQILRFKERFGYYPIHLRLRIRQLKEERAALRNTLNSLAEAENTVEIKFTVDLKIKKQNRKNTFSENSSVNIEDDLKCAV